MTEHGIGSMHWVQDFVGIPYEQLGRSTIGIDCWGLVSLVYKARLAIALPDWAVDDEIDWDNTVGKWEVIEHPINFSLIRTSYTGLVPDHWGIYVGGGVLSADRPMSSFASFDQYMQRHPNSEVGVFKINEDILS